MTGRVLAIITACVLGVAFVCVAAIAGIGGFASPCMMLPALPGSTSGYDADQMHNAAIIVGVGARRGIAPRGQVIAVATAMQESNLRNLGNLGKDNDHDSLGLFQQRPSAGWGRPARIMNPEYAAGRFYDKLLTVANWQTLPLTVAAQAVQISAYPDAYAKHEPDATAIVTAVVSGDPRAIPVDREQCVSICAEVVASPDGSGGSCVEASAVFDRARSWLTAWRGGPVPYLSSNVPGDLFHGYRRDCSGYVSMALGLRGPGLSTVELAQRSMMIGKSDLRPGDLMINPDTDLRGHVVLFAGWVDASIGSYYGYEQSGGGGTHFRKIPYPYFGSYRMSPYRLGD
ncbi:NlpC/P60 family protein [Jidongwangia harbinensis]|uniref:NlpC/P60 family protein n=1 Tax=Jidongwangia harbinensis TaxID=2878561 RepID=UPI001CDA4D89|nr:NlpC/P60 family protein [Jidongwangia harbinensis]MCA2216338.1 NlpC/P60 family protein [Jidongwangia harbinensis]MCA2217073.1 NlpC/P60 family protein [Jidongwangia harbinensis]